MTGSNRVVERDDVLALLAELERWQRAGTALVRLWPCGRCAAATDAPCRGRSGMPLRPRGQLVKTDSHHAPRLNGAARASGSLSVWSRRQDLRAGVSPEWVSAKIQQSALYKRLSELDRIKVLPLIVAEKGKHHVSA